MNWSEIWGKFYRKQRGEKVEAPVVVAPEPSIFDGAYVTKEDDARLTKQQKVIYELMKDGGWRTLRSISSVTGIPEASVSAQLRNLRKPKFGGHQVITRHLTGTGRGNYEYQLTLKV